MENYRINGEGLIGFGDFFSGYDEIGAGERPGTPGGTGGQKEKKKKKSPGGAVSGARLYPKGKRSTAVEYHGKVLVKSRGIVTKAAKTIGLAQHLLSKKPPSVRLPSGRAIAGPVHVGAVAAAGMSPKAKLAISKHNAAVKKSAEASKVLAQHAIKTKASVAELAKKMVNQKKIAKIVRTPPSKRTHVGELLADPVIGDMVGEAFQDYYTAVGADPDPANPGFLTDGSPDPAAAAPTDTTDVPLTDDPLDSGATLPAAPPMDHFFADMTDPGVGGIAYDNSKGTPEGFVGSYGLFTRATDNEAAAGGRWVWPIDWMDHYGVVWGLYDKDLNGGFPGGDELAKSAWNHFHGGKGRGDWHNALDPAGAFQSVTVNSPQGKQYGPLVGNPGMKDFAHMRVDAQGNMFWLPQEAPDWLTFPIKQAAALTAQAAKKAEEEAAKAAAAAEAKARADEASAKAAQDAANALAESQAASQARVAKGEEETKQAAAETKAQEAIVQQQTAETTAKGLETEQMKAAGELMIAQAKRQQEYYVAHPEEEFAPQGGGGEEAEEGEMEEPPMPGGDIMQDADGEGYQDEE